MSWLNSFTVSKVHRVFYLSSLIFLSACISPTHVFSFLARNLFQITWSDRDKIWVAQRAAASGEVTVLQPRPVIETVHIKSLLPSPQDFFFKKSKVVFLWFDTLHPSQQFFSHVIFDKISTAIRITADMLNWQYLTIGSIFSNSLCIGPAQAETQRAIKMSRISSHLVTAWSNYITAFLAVM